MKRPIIRIDEDRCTGCGLCVPNCPEGAIQIIDEKARLVSDLFCDGLGACLGHCPEGAILIEEREAEPYDEYRVMENVVPHGENTIRAHLLHLKEHGQEEFLRQAVDYLRKNDIQVPVLEEKTAGPSGHTGCPGSRAMTFERTAGGDHEPGAAGPSELTHWPIQMHLISPSAPQYRGADLLLAADCTAFSLGAFHRDYLRGRALAIACPKLDGGREIYAEKLRALIDEAKIETLTVLVMQVPCCSGLVELARRTAAGTGRKVPIRAVVVGIQGQILDETRVA